jgi:hypothetical protein
MSFLGRSNMYLHLGEFPTHAHGGGSLHESSKQAALIIHEAAIGMSG